MASSKIHLLKMSPELMEKFQVFLMERSGLVFEGRRIQEIERTVARRMIELGFASFEEYYEFITGRAEGGDELNQLVITLTVGETQFFRTPDQFAALRNYVFPELIERGRKVGKSLNILTAGCATGEEPYSICILLDDLIPDIDSWDITIRACDINREFLDAAREGAYGERKLRLVDLDTREKYFDRLAKNLYRVNERLRDRVEFSHFNINAADYTPLTRGLSYHLVLCRNVLIYFNMNTIKHTIDKLYKIIARNGYLMLGYSETLFKISDAFQSVHTPEAFFYQKSEKPTGYHVVELTPDKPTPYEREDFIKALGSKPHPLAEGKSAAPGLPDWFKKVSEALAPRAAPDKCETEPAGMKPAAPAPPAEKPKPAETIGEEDLWERALGCFSEERFEEAGALFEKMLEIEPCSARAHLGLGFLYANMGAEERSRRYAEEARRYDDLLPEIYLLLALLDEKNGNYQMAVGNYQRVILLDPDFAMAHFNLGNLFLKMDRYRDARREFGNTIDILERDTDNKSLRFSGGLGREAVIEFCRMQRDHIARAVSGPGGG